MIKALNSAISSLGLKKNIEPVVTANGLRYRGVLSPGLSYGADSTLIVSSLPASFKLRQRQTSFSKMLTNTIFPFKEASEFLVARKFLN